MSAALTNTAVNPLMDEAYKILNQLSEEHITDVVKYMKKLLSRDNAEAEELAKRKAEFQELLQIREKAKNLHLKSLEEERYEAMAEKYPFLRDEPRKE